MLALPYTLSASFFLPSLATYVGFPQKSSSHSVLSQLSTSSQGLPTSTTLPELFPSPPQLGAPPLGVICQTQREPAHLLDGDYINDVQIEAGDAYQRWVQSLGTRDGGPDSIPWPRAFDPQSMMGTDGHGKQYTVVTPGDCKWSGLLLFMPISYPGTAAPRVTDVVDFEPYGTVTTDILVFQTRGPGYMDAVGTRWKTSYCAILTNSDAGEGRELYANGRVNARVGGYHQCDDAEVR
ncbi:uncharacterized protein KY384_006255 [Bacidia gigantensis]|uniref:uncharacterized protein n=1 Tax=Bacidia gigantensis TaxID=2732470 RepID=UPI001D04A8B4|nr:uncharacterized protein KY384_006255 [Bacidia gigantensis]KAG8529618.1 hypothetical protein KY384_006255 [Bacidia gigantensis]